VVGWQHGKAERIQTRGAATFVAPWAVTPRKIARGTKSSASCLCENRTELFCATNSAVPVKTSNGGIGQRLPYEQQQCTFVVSVRAGVCLVGGSVLWAGAPFSPRISARVTLFPPAPRSPSLNCEWNGTHIQHLRELLARRTRHASGDCCQAPTLHDMAGFKNRRWDIRQDGT